jgi:hypothetical protein
MSVFDELKDLWEENPPRATALVIWVGPMLVVATMMISIAVAISLGWIP